ncbi:MAG: S8/S53 family peptidase [bacterium]|nr:S8/S53 family peptidase [bacterium]
MLWIAGFILGLVIAGAVPAAAHGKKGHHKKGGGPQPKTQSAGKWKTERKYKDALKHESREQGRKTLMALGYCSGLNPTDLPLVSGDLGFSIPPAGLGLDRAHGTARGGGVIVAVLDGGFNLEHPALRGRLLHGYDAIGGDHDVNDPGNGEDDDGDGITDAGLGHGTFVAGMILQTAPDAMILPVRVADDEGLSTTVEIAAGLDYALQMGAAVINISSEAPKTSYYIRERLEEAQRLGVIVIVSAGNGGDDHLGFLAGEATTIAVGALREPGTVAEFSNRGPGVCTYAPGTELVGPLGWPTEDNWCVWSGTSFAAGLVSGAAALARELDSDLTADALRGYLKESGRSVSGKGRKFPKIDDGRMHVGDLVTLLATQAGWSNKK